MRSDYHAKDLDAKWGLRPNREEWVGARPQIYLRQIGRTFRRRMALRLPDHLPVSMPVCPSHGAVLCIDALVLSFDCRGRSSVIGVFA